VKINQNRKHYYHITDEDWPEQVRLYPLKENRGRGASEPKFSRICVCPSVPLCLSAFEIYHYRYAIYKTQYAITAVQPWDLSDQFLTKEMWIIKPINFIFVGMLDEMLQKEIQGYRHNLIHFYFGNYKADLEVQAIYKDKIFKYFEKNKLNPIP